MSAPSAETRRTATSTRPSRNYPGPVPGTASRRVVCVVLMLAAMIAGLFVRHAPLRLPWSIYKYGGSLLWAVALYWLVAALLARYGSQVIAPVTAVIAVLVELSRLVHTPALDAFRPTLPGRLLLGSVFSVKDIAAYWLAIALTALADDLVATRLRRR